MPGKGPAPLKKADDKRRSNAGQGFTVLARNARDGKEVPPWPLPTAEDSALEILEAAEWARLWSLPQADEWERMRCEPTVALYVRVFVKASATGGDPKLLNEFRQLDSKIGISPRAMLDLRWYTEEMLEEAYEEVGKSTEERVFVPQAR